MKDNKMVNISHAFVKSVLHIFTEKSLAKLANHIFKGYPTTLLKLPQNWVICI